MTIIKVMPGATGRFKLVYAPQVIEHLQTIERKHHSLIRKAIEEQLAFEPDTESTNRKPLREPAAFEATWEIRFGPRNRFRVFYEVDRDEREVYILAIGSKQGNRLIVGRQEIEL
jgi:mRNA-degrading endonuclease RelE of RelBE toxin-antitoxin system